MNIFLCGFMGSGKTTVGKALSTDLNMDFIDLDKLIEIENNESINEIFKMIPKSISHKINNYQSNQY